jgi:hypothetical protein
MKEQPAPGTAAGKSGYQARFWPQLKRLLIFQIKLYVDAIRDLLLSALSLFAFIGDVMLQNHGKDSLFEGVLRLGRKSERAINLFEQYDPGSQGRHSVDGVIRKVEDRFR